MMMAASGWIVAAILDVAIIGLHYEIIRVVSDYFLPRALKRFHDRRVMMMTIVMLMIGHIIEIWIFAFAMFLATLDPKLGFLAGAADGDFNTFLYFSAVSYTSTGYGDVIPHGIIRPISVSEALAGLLMIAWSASFTYLKMEQIWSLRRERTR